MSFEIAFEFWFFFNSQSLLLTLALLSAGHLKKKFVFLNLFGARFWIWFLFKKIGFALSRTIPKSIWIKTNGFGRFCRPKTFGFPTDLKTRSHQMSLKTHLDKAKRIWTFLQAEHIWFSNQFENVFKPNEFENSFG